MKKVKWTHRKSGVSGYGWQDEQGSIWASEATTDGSLIIPACFLYCYTITEVRFFAGENVSHDGDVGVVIGYDSVGRAVLEKEAQLPMWFTLCAVPIADLRPHVATRDILVKGLTGNEERWLRDSRKSGLAPVPPLESILDKLAAAVKQQKEGI